MRVQIKRRLLAKRTPDSAERAYRQMLAEKMYEKNKEHWFLMWKQTPGI